MTLEHYREARYDDAFFDSHEEVALASARAAVPLLLEIIQPASVIDVGCGRGAWLKAFGEHGVAALRGVDGPHVNQDRLLIDRACFTVADLGKPFHLEGRFDLAVCLEVAEHLSYAVGPQLVQNLTDLAPLVLFSAAIPGQGGTGHINEQWPPYWRRLFADRGYQRLDPLRPRLKQDARVAWWYRQNLFLFASAAAVANSAALQEQAHGAETEFEVIHVNALYGLNEFYRYQSLSGLLREIPRVAWRAVRHRLGR